MAKAKKKTTKKTKTRAKPKARSKSRAQAKPKPRSKSGARAKPKTKRRPNAKRAIASLVKESGGARGLLSEALGDIERELNSLRNEKIDSERELIRLSDTVEDTQDAELSIKEKLGKLIHKEEELGVRKRKLAEKVEKIKLKIEKISQISTEMEGIS